MKGLASACHRATRRSQPRGVRMPEATRESSFTIGMVLFEGVTQLDLTGPYEVFARMPGARVVLIAERADPVRTEWGMTIAPQASFADAPPLDLLCVPGGWGVDAQLRNE